MLKTNWFGFLFLIFSMCTAQQEYSRLTEIVTDDAQIFTQVQLDGLRDKLYRFESETSNQLVVLTIDDLGGETIEQYALDVFNENRLGQDGRDNGILILFFGENDRKKAGNASFISLGLKPSVLPIRNRTQKLSQWLTTFTKPLIFRK